MTEIAFTSFFNIPQPDCFIDINCFGIFTTIESMNTIHGCIGKWNHDFKPYSNNEICNVLKRISYSSMFEDSRARNTPNAHREASTLIKVSFMYDNKKLYDTSSFNNKEYGIIVYGKNGKTATFLPGVYPDKDFSFIKTKLAEKANLNLNSSLIFYTYKCHIFLDTLGSCVHKLSGYYSKKILDFFNNKYGLFFPYLVNKHEKVLHDTTQSVRNIATIGDVLRANNTYKILTSETKNKIMKDLSFYNPNKLSKAARSFLSRINNTCYTETVDDIDDKVFELNQVIISQSKVCSKNMLDMINLNTKIEQDSVFRLNWQTQAICSGKQINKVYLKKLFNMGLEWFSLYYNQNLETNYIVVFFEFLCFIKAYMNKKVYKIIDDLILNVFIDLSKRFDNNIGLFKFINNTCRIDISGHFLNGINALIN